MRPLPTPPSRGSARRPRRRSLPTSRRPTSSSWSRPTPTRPTRSSASRSTWGSSGRGSTSGSSPTRKGSSPASPAPRPWSIRREARLVLFNTLANVIITEKLADPAAAALEGYDLLVKAVAGCTVEKAAAVTGLTADAITALAREYATAEKALILLPLGLGYPGHNAALAQSLLNLAILTGRIGKEGSGVLFMGEKNNSQGAVDMGIIPGAAGKDAAGIIDGCAAGSVKALYVVGENPVVSYPNRKKVEAALDKVEFLVVQDLFLTETAQKAHVVLPACSFAEKDGTFTSVGRNVQKVNKAIKPVGASKTDFEIFNKLYADFTGKPAYLSAQAVFNEITQTVPGYAGLSWARLGTERRHPSGGCITETRCRGSCGAGSRGRQVRPPHRQRPQPLRHHVPVRRRAHAGLPGRVRGIRPGRRQEAGTGRRGQGHRHLGCRVRDPAGQARYPALRRGRLCAVPFRVELHQHHRHRRPGHLGQRGEGEIIHKRCRSVLRARTSRFAG